MDKQKGVELEERNIFNQKRQQPAYNPNGFFKIRLEVKKDKPENLERLLRLIGILNEVTDEKRVEQNGSLVVELNVGERRKPEIIPEKHYETRAPDSDAKIKINIEKLKPRTLQFQLIARQSCMSKDKLEELINSINLLGKTSSLQETFSTDGEKAYKLSFVLDTDIYGVNFINAIKELIEDAKFLLEYKKVSRNLEEIDRWLGKWKGGDFTLRKKIASDVQQMYDILNRDYNILMETILSKHKEKNTVKARIAIAYILHEKKYDENGEKLSSVTIGEILNKNHATILFGIGRCKEVELTQNDLDNFPTAFEKIFKGYKRGYEGRKPKKESV